MTDTAKPETPYVETELLLSVMNQDFSRAGSLAREMNRRERDELRTALGYARQLLDVADLYASVGHATGDPHR